MIGEKKCRKLSTGIGRKAWKQAGRKRKEAPEEPPTGENGKKGKEDVCKTNVIHSWRIIHNFLNVKCSLMLSS